VESHHSEDETDILLNTGACLVPGNNRGTLTGHGSGGSPRDSDSEGYGTVLTIAC